MTVESPAPSSSATGGGGHRRPRAALLDEIVLFVVFTGILVASAWLSPQAEGVSLFGYRLPPLCLFREITGHRCPGCGLTRSFTYMGHLQVEAAFRMHPLGPFLYGLVVHQAVVRGYGLIRRAWRGARPAASPPPRETH